MRTIDRFLILLVAAIAPPGIANAAALTTESFTSGLSGWTNGLDATKWVAASQAASVSFVGNVLPQTAALDIERLDLCFAPVGEKHCYL